MLMALCYYPTLQIIKNNSMPLMTKLKVNVDKSKVMVFEEEHKSISFWYSFIYRLSLAYK